MDEAPPLLVTVTGGDQQRPVTCPFCNAPARYAAKSTVAQTNTVISICILFVFDKVNFRRTNFKKILVFYIAKFVKL